MDRESMERLKLDWRLIRRPGWISKEDLERELATLPDVSDKIAPAGAELGEEGSAEPSPARSPEAPSSE